MSNLADSLKKPQCLIYGDEQQHIDGKGHVVSVTWISLTKQRKHINVPVGFHHGLLYH